MYDDALPVTGTGALLIAGHQIGLGMIVTVALAMIVTGALIYRRATRGKRYSG